jgi:hypothetical protein
MNPPSGHPAGSTPAIAGCTGCTGCAEQLPSMTSNSMCTPPSSLVFVKHPTSVLPRRQQRNRHSSWFCLSLNFCSKSSTTCSCLPGSGTLCNFRYINFSLYIATENRMKIFYIYIQYVYLKLKLSIVNVNHICTVLGLSVAETIPCMHCCIWIL